jgi:integrase
MPNVKFILKEPNSKERTLIYLFFRFNKRILKYSFGQKINPKYWNPEKQRAKETKQFPEHPEFNALLNKYEACSNNAFRKLLNDGTRITTEVLKREIIKLINNNGSSGNITFYKFIEDYIDTTNKKPNTVKHYKQTQRILNEYRDHVKHNIDFDDITLDFYDDFVNYLNEKKYHANTIGGYVKNIKVFMNEALDRKLTTNIDFRSRKFRTLEAESESIYLSVDEIERIYKLDLSNNPKLDKVRDTFVIACYTGLRFSDLKQISNENLINNNSQLKIITEKTGEMVIIPLHPYIKSIINKYGGEIPQVISNQKMNEYVKDVGKLAEIKEKIIISSIKGGKTVKESFEKHDLITVHTARRSFATNAYLAEVPTISIMKITGHRTERAFLKYIKISQEDNANKLLDHKFFK